MKILKFVLISIILLFILTGCGENQDHSEENFAIPKNENSSSSNSYNNETNNSIDNSIITSTNVVSTFSTPIKDNSSGRLTNIAITCNTLNGTIIEPNETFSFNKLIGQPTAEKGYQEASIIIDHHTATGIGGGNCQVSSTLYNAVLNLKNLTIVERHEHGKNVGYVPEGKDATVSYGSLDFKFRNDTGHRIRIDATADNNNVTINLVQ